jgi:hypothetical protein
VFTFQGGTDKLVNQMREELEKNGVDIRIRSLVEKVELNPDRSVAAVWVNGKRVGCGAVLSNANIKSTIFKLVGEENFSKEYADEARAVRLNNSSCQVYIALKPGEGFDNVGDLLFHSEHSGFDINAMLSMNVSSRTFSFYYPETRPGSDRWLVVSSTNANYADWAKMSEEEYEREKAKLCESTLDCLEKYVPDVRQKLDWVEASTPRTFEHYTRHLEGASFGTKFEGLKVSQTLPQQIGGDHHVGLAGGRELRRDRRQRAGQVPDGGRGEEAGGGGLRAGLSACNAGRAVETGPAGWALTQRRLAGARPTNDAACLSAGSPWIRAGQRTAGGFTSLRTSHAACPPVSSVWQLSPRPWQGVPPRATRQRGDYFVRLNLKSFLAGSLSTVAVRPDFAASVNFLLNGGGAGFLYPSMPGMAGLFSPIGATETV